MLVVLILQHGVADSRNLLLGHSLHQPLCLRLHGRHNHVLSCRSGIKAGTLDIGPNDPHTVLVHLDVSDLFVLGLARLLSVGQD